MSMRGAGFELTVAISMMLAVVSKFPLPIVALHPVVRSSEAVVRAVQIAAGVDHTCVVTDAGGVMCWGFNAYGQLGDGTTIDRSIPVAVSGLSSGVVKIAMGGYHTCVLMDAGGVKCWGNNYDGQLGDGTTASQFTPVSVSDLGSGVVDITAGSLHTCALTDKGEALCWGYNNFGQLGNGTPWSSVTPGVVSGLSSGVTGVEAGWMHTCASLAAGGVKCWGHNEYGELGNETGYYYSLMPVDVKDLESKIVALAAGGNHTCALTSAGGVKCWGRNTEGELGNGTAINSTDPVDVNELNSGVVALVAESMHTCALTSASSAKCWGDNHEGELGDGTRINRYVPVSVSGFSSGIVTITAGALHDCALTSSGVALCWGSNHYGQLGNGQQGDILELKPIVVIGFGLDHTLYLPQMQHLFMRRQ